MLWLFAKYAGCGNDFILFDNRRGDFPKSPQLFQKLCHRQWGIGADGIILLESSSQAHARMRIFNADGSEAEMCGNGIRCLVHWMNSLGFSLPIYHIETMNHVLKAWVTDQNVRIEMGSPTHLQWNLSIDHESTYLQIHSLNTGVPHAVLFVSDIEANLKQLGPYIRHHPYWKPNGTNFSIVKQLDAMTFAIRTFERGVEDETLACGTGATAAALAAAHQFKLQAPLRMQTRSGDCLDIHFSLEDGQFTNVTMTGPATKIFQGEVDLYP